MANLNFGEIYDKRGNPMKNRDNILIERIANKQLLKLDKDKGYIKVFDIEVVFQDGTKSSYNWQDLKKESIVRSLKMDMNSAAQQKGNKKKLATSSQKHQKSCPNLSEISQKSSKIGSRRLLGTAPGPL